MNPPSDIKQKMLWPRRSNEYRVEKPLMTLPAGWQNPIVVPAGQIQKEVDARLLLPSRNDLIPLWLDFQRSLRQAGRQRLTPIQVTVQGVIWDGHHAIRAAAERAETVDVLIVDATAPASGLTILQLPVR